MCGTGINGLLSSLSGLLSSITKGVSISNKSGLWTAKIDAVNDELSKGLPFTPSTKSLTTGSALNVPPANSNLNGSPLCLLINVPLPTASGCLAFVSTGGGVVFGLEATGGIGGVGGGEGCACGSWNSSYFCSTISVSIAVVSDVFCWFLGLAA